MTTDHLASPDMAQPVGAYTDPRGDTVSTPARSRRGRRGRSQPSGSASSARAATSGNLWFSNWLYRSREMSAIWLIVRLWLGYQWTNAGYQKIWGNERSAFWFGGGSGVKGFATAGVLGSASGKGGASYGWWAAFLHNFVIPNASVLGKVVSASELLIGIGLIVGLFTGAAALAGVLLNLMYMFSGSAGVNPMYALLGTLLVLAWRNAGWVGLDGLLFRSKWRLHRVPSGTESALHPGVAEAEVSH
jgi:thiosulfate dehydrogenase (quinone) large subunit